MITIYPIPVYPTAEANKRDLSYVIEPDASSAR
jgi:hypothetical protein